jgi:hypothetical protein
MFPWKYFFFTKRERSKEIKTRVVYTKGVVSSTLANSPEVWEHPWGSHLWAPLPCKNALTHEPPQQHKLQLLLVKRTLHFAYLKHGWVHAKRQATFKY